MLELKVKKLDDDAKLPVYANPGDAGMDLFSLKEYSLYPGKRALIKTGIAVEIPLGYELQIRPRSGLALKHGLSIVNSPGTIDSGYRGEIGIILINHGGEKYEIKKWDKIAQAVLNKVEHCNIIEVNELGETQRSSGGFGSTGK